MPIVKFMVYEATAPRLGGGRVRVGDGEMVCLFMLNVLLESPGRRQLDPPLLKSLFSFRDRRGVPFATQALTHPMALWPLDGAVVRQVDKRSIRGEGRVRLVCDLRTSFRLRLEIGGVVEGVFKYTDIEFWYATSPAGVAVHARIFLGAQRAAGDGYAMFEYVMPFQHWLWRRAPELAGDEYELESASGAEVVRLADAIPELTPCPIEVLDA